MSEAGKGQVHTRHEAAIPADLIESTRSIVVDQLEAAQLESGDLIKAGVDWSRVVGLGEVLAGKAAGRTSEDQTILFESHGLALWDVAAGATVLAAARAQSIGQELELF